MEFHKLLRNWPLHLMLIPGIILVFFFSYVPLAGVVMAFQKFMPNKGWFGSEWIGWQNFRYMLELPDIGRIVRNTLYISSMKIVIGQIIPIVIAILLNEIKNALVKKGVQTLIYLPHFLSWVLLGGILIDILSTDGGLVNQFLGIFGIDPIFFLGSNDWFPFVLVFSDVWKEFGFSTIIYLAAITSIDPALYEAAYVDGAGKFKQAIHVTLTGMAPIIILVATLSLGNVLNAGFEQVFNLYSPQVYESGDIIDTRVYRIGLVDVQYGLATAVGLFKSFVSLILVGISYWSAYRFANYRIF
ncbi:ABC transporter permease [Paenibacillus sp. SYP-B4298]|uniref:ABC transporter permease n=1 Tax=Paenibacillus sp. SYP-B4298 TaxID=2996034 RepID=UPI0022DD4846|nr:ABC transporter permease subunit [Paenibacillus sp. SYP-B4298]